MYGRLILQKIRKGKKMNKKILYGFIILIVIVVIGGVIYFLINNNKEEDINIDLQSLNATLSSQPPFNELATMDVTVETLETVLQITSDEVEEVIGKMPMMNVQASMYIVIKAKDEAVDTVKTKIESYGASYEEQWSTYLPEQYELVKQRKIGVKGNYVYLIISENSSDLEALVK